MNVFLDPQVAWLTLPIILMDGIFHLRAGTLKGKQFLEKHSPDWVLARKVGHDGMPQWVHTLIGVFLITSSVYVMSLLRSGRMQTSCFAHTFQTLVTPFTLAVIVATLVVRITSRA